MWKANGSKGEGSKERKEVMGLQEKYEKEVKVNLAKELNIKNVMAIPKITKVVINMGTGDTYKNKDVFAKVAEGVGAITGQKPKVTKAKTSIAGFNLREGQPVGLTVTLRGKKMYAFLEKVISIVLPRLRDFRGIGTKGFDKFGNYTLGFAENTVFPEIDITKIDKPRGLEVTIVTSAKNEKEARKLLDMIGMPFEKKE
ncbi:MAG TPA: 50S ribosomal protein L5 [Patescibacteria group bacterium]